VPFMTKRLDGVIRAMTFSNDGKQVVVGVRTSAIVLDTTTGRQQRVLSQAKDCYLVKFSWDGTRLVTVSYDMIGIWDAFTFQLLRKLDVDYATVSIEGTQILTVSSTDADGHRQLELLDIFTGTPVRTLTLKMTFTEDYPFHKMAFSSVGNRFLVPSDKSVGIWDISEADSVLKEPITLDGCTSRILGIAISPNGEQVATGSFDASLRVWDASTGNVSLVLPHKSAVPALHFSSDGTRIVSATTGGTLHVWDAITGAQLRVLVTNPDYITSIALSRDSSRICSGSRNNVHVWSCEESTQAEQIFIPALLVNSIVNDIWLSDDCKTIISVTSDKVHIWDAATGAELRSISCPDTWWLPKLSGNGQTIVSCLTSGPLVVWDFTTGDKIMHLEHTANSYISIVASSRSGNKFAFIRRTSFSDGISTHWQYLLEICNVQNGQEREIVLDNEPFFIAFSSDEKYILCGMARKLGGTGCIIVWNVLTGDVTHKITSQITDILGGVLKFASNGKHVLTCTSFLSTKSTSDFLFELWDISSGKQLQVVKSFYYHTTSHDRESAPSLQVGLLALSNNSEKIVMGCSDGFIRIWDIVEDAAAVVIGFGGRVTTLTFSGDDKQIVSSSVDGSLRVWDLDTAKYDWTLQDSGWIISQKKKHRLMWISEFLRVIQPCNILIISSPEHGAVEFERAMIGEDWEKCYTPRNFASTKQ